MKHKLSTYAVIFTIVAGLLVIIAACARFYLGDDDSWIKNSTESYVKHGNPANTPDYVNAQNTALLCASELYANASDNGTIFDSQCLGRCGNYSVDIVHVPRILEDSFSSNQCSEYSLGRTTNFIELDNQGKIVRVV
jgi:hypothetical protein